MPPPLRGRVGRVLIKTTPYNPLTAMKPQLYSITHATCTCLLALILVLGNTSCERIWDNEYCGTEYRVKFVYDYNMLFTDAFPTQVRSVTLYAFDEDGRLAFQQMEKGDALAEDDYSMVLDVCPGRYDLVAWAGTEEGDGFSLPTLTPGQSTIDDLYCRINRHVHTLHGEQVDSVGQLQPLWHGILQSQAVVTRAPSYTEYVTVPLVKNTNTLRIILQQTTAGELDASDFTFTVTDENGLMLHDNALDTTDGTLTYLPYYTTNGSADSGEGEGLNVAIAELTVGRLMADHNPTLRIARRSSNRTVLSIPLVRYLDLCRTTANYDMPLQEYLDREDTYAMTFFLDANGAWLDTQVIINDWIVRFNDIEQ